MNNFYLWIQKLRRGTFPLISKPIPEFDSLASLTSRRSPAATGVTIGIRFNSSSVRLRRFTVLHQLWTATRVGRLRSGCMPRRTGYDPWFPYNSGTSGLACGWIISSRCEFRPRERLSALTVRGGARRRWILTVVVESPRGGISP
jgi:hypothetical protein